MVLIRSYVLAGLVAVASAQSAVLDLIPKNFDDLVLKSGKPTLVEFFAPWCGHCKNLAPVYEDLAQAFQSSKDVQIAKVDADAEKDLGKRFSVQGFPTLKWFDGTSDTPIDYDGGRDFDSLANFITEKTGVKPKKKWVPPSNVQMLHDHSFSEFVGKDKDVFVAFTAPWCGHCKTLAPVWEELATIYAPEEGVLIAKVDCDADNSKGVAKQEGVSSFPTIKWFKKGSMESELYEGGRKIENFIKFVNREASLHRTVGGSLDDVAGTIESLNAIVAKYAAAGKDKLAEYTAEVKAETEKLTDAAEAKYGQYYLRVFDKLGQNEGYVDKELTRLNGMLSKGGLALPKRDEITTKLNVLKKFVEKAVEDVKGDAEDAKDEL